MPIYKDDLAYIHHAGFTQALRRSAPHLLRLLARCGVESGTVVDLACGSGVWARVLTEAGYDVVGVDTSQAMLRLARRVAPAAFKQASLYRADIPHCAAVTALGECLNYAEAGTSAATRTRQAEQLLRRVFRRLRPGGVFVFDVHTRTTSASLRHRAVSLSGKDWAILHEAEINAAGTRLTRQIIAFRQIGPIAAGLRFITCFSTMRRPWRGRSEAWDFAFAGSDATVMSRCCRAASDSSRESRTGSAERDSRILSKLTLRPSKHPGWDLCR